MSESKAIGIDFGGTSVKLAIVSGAELVSDIHRIPTQDFDNPDDLIARINQEINLMCEENPGASAVGIGVPGAVDYGAGVTYKLTNVKGWSEVPLRDIMQEQTGLPTVLDNDANCMAFAEWKYGAASGYRHAVCVTLGTGVGGGLILNGELFRGGAYAAGEIGQMSVDLNGVEGPYGNSGALERYIGNRQIEEMAKELYRTNGALAPEDCSPENLATLAAKGDVIAVSVWQNVANYLGACLMSVVYLLNPEVIVVGGGVSHSGNLLFDPLKKKLQDTLTLECFENLTVVPARYGNTAGILGSSAMALDLLEN
ncbi:MAG: sugar kinase [Verrucomicrobiales bacterium]|nr:sugar kinase [Verrucomicrobiales bacterium]